MQGTGAYRQLTFLLPSELSVSASDVGLAPLPLTTDAAFRSLIGQGPLERACGCKVQFAVWAQIYKRHLAQTRIFYAQSGGFFFFIFKKIKISKIYVRFGKFQKYTPVALGGRQG